MLKKLDVSVAAQSAALKRWGNSPAILGESGDKLGLFHGDRIQSDFGMSNLTRVCMATFEKGWEKHQIGCGVAWSLGGPVLYL